MRLLEVEGLTKKYPKFTLKNVSFSLEQGRIMGLIGKNGAGKILVNKQPDGALSPNRADSVMICFSDIKPPARLRPGGGGSRSF